MSEVKGRCPPPRAGPDFMFLVSVSLVQINGTAWRFHLEIQEHQPSPPSWDGREFWGKTMQLSPPWIKNQAALRPGEGVATQDVWFAEHGESTPKRKWGSCSHEAMRSKAMWLNPKGVHPEKAQPAFWCIKFQSSWFSSWILISHHSKLKHPKRS